MRRAPLTSETQDLLSVLTKELKAMSMRDRMALSQKSGVSLRMIYYLQSSPRNTSLGSFIRLIEAMDYKVELSKK
jgi:hypothetical protein